MLRDLSTVGAVNPDGIPQEMKAVRRWVTWVGVQKRRQDGSVEYTKEPRRADNPAARASSTRETTWADFETAMDAVRRQQVHGLGFVLGDGWIGVDLDDAYDADGNLKPMAADVVTRVATYAERSVSGEGVHLIARGEVPEGRKWEDVEVYGAGRYFTVTGDHLAGTPATVEHRTAEVEQLLQRLCQRDVAAGRRCGAALVVPGHNDGDEPEPPAAIDKILEVAHRECRGFAAVWRGDFRAYNGDHSRAEMAVAGWLAFVCGRGQERLVRRIMWESDLRREKWTTNRKYLDRTIARAFEGRGENDFYRWQPRRETRRVQLAAQGGEAAPHAGAGPIDLRREVTLDDIGFARRLAMEASHTMRYVTDWKKWIHWDGMRWRIDDNAPAIQAAQRLRDQLWREFADLPHEQRTEKALQFVKACGGARRLEGIVKLAAAQEPLRIGHDQLDRHPFLLNVRNGTVDLRTGELHPHNRELLITQLAAVNYERDAESALWQRFITQAADSDPELMRFLQVSAGLALSGDVSPQALWCHHGSGGNGKSTYLGALVKMLGDYAGPAPHDFLMIKQGSSHPTELAMLYGKRLVTAVECEGGRRLRESFVKMITGGDVVAARRMNEDFWDMQPTWHVHVTFNDPPTISGTDDGIRRRLKVVPWRVSFRGANQDRSVKDALEAEEHRSGILNWCLCGIQQWLASGQLEAAAVAQATQEYVAEQDIFGTFITEECTPNPQEHVVFDAIQRHFRSWLEQRGENADRWTGRRVATELKRRGFEKDRPTSGPRRGQTLYRGLFHTMSS
jgi:putative DNA primase/helicase